VAREQVEKRLFQDVGACAESATKCSERDPANNDHRDSAKTENHPERFLIVRSNDDVVHVFYESGQDYQSDVTPGTRLPQQKKKMEGARRLPAAK